MDIGNVLFNEMIDIIEKIVNNRFDELDREGKLKEVKREDIIREITAYGGKLTHAEIEDYYKSYDCIKINNSNLYTVYLDFWFNHTRSDLTLMCEIELDEACNIISSTVIDIHVL